MHHKDAQILDKQAAAKETIRKSQSASIIMLGI